MICGSGVLICGGDVVSMYGSAENEKVALSSALNAKSCPGPLIKVKALNIIINLLELGAPLSLQELENGRNYKVANR